MSTPFIVGRDDEQQVLAAALDRALSGAGGLVLITGEAGIGKTALLSVGLARARAAGAIVATGTCWDGEGAPGYWPWTQAMRALRLESTDDLWDRAARDAGAGLDRLVGTEHLTAVEATAFDVVDAITTVLQVLSREQPLAVALDDLHWADRPSIALLAGLIGPAQLGRILLVGAFRHDEVAAPDHPVHHDLADIAARATSIRLAGLDVDGCAALLARDTRSPAPDRMVEVQRRTGGNPFFVQQLAHLWESTGTSTAVPLGIDAAIERRIARLPSSVADALIGASVLGQWFDVELLASVLDLDVDDLRAMLETARSAGLVAPDEARGWRFVHDLVREVLYASTTTGDRRRHHAAATRSLQRAPSASGTLAATDIAHHAVLAVPEIPVADAVELLVVAAAAASGRMAAEEAARHFERVLEFLDSDDSRRSAIAAQLATEQRRAGLLDASRATFSSVLNDAAKSDDAAAYALAAIGLHELGAVIHESVDRMRQLVEARSRLERDTRLPATERDALASKVLGSIVRARVHRTEPDRSGLDELSAEAVDLARRSGDPAALAFTLLARHDAIWDPDTAEARLDLVIEMAAAATDGADPEMELQAVLLEFVARLELGDPSALAAIERYYELEARLQLPRCRYVALSRRATVATMRGQFDDAEGYIAEAYALGERIGEVDREGVNCDQSWELARQRGDFDAIDDVLTKFRGDPHLIVLEIAAALDRGDLAETERLRARFAELGVVWPRWARTVWWAQEAELAVASSDASRCRDVRALLAPLTGRWAILGGGVLVRGPVDHWLALLDMALGDLDAAVKEFEAARVSAERLGARPWVVHARVGLARALTNRAALGDDADAASAIAAALSEAENLYMQRVVDQLRGLAANLAVARAHFVRDGDLWMLTFDNATIRLPDAKGLRDLHELLSHPGVDIPALDLLSLDIGEGVVTSARMGSDVVLDDRARAEYRNRLTVIDDDIDRALQRGDDAEAQQLDAERDAVLAELQAATGLGGRRRRLGDDSERARKTVTARIRDTMRRLEDRHPTLASHLAESIATGTTCRYDPVDPVAWRT